MIIDYKDGMRIKDQFLVANVSKGTNVSGVPYLSIELRDASGTINGKKWELTAEDETIFVIGNVVMLEAETLKYKDALQLKIHAASLVNIDEIDVSKFVKAPPIPQEELIKRFHDYVSSIQNEDCQKLLQYFINKYRDKIYSFPAGVSVHHEYMSGLLVHMTTMAKVADSLVAIYDNVDRDMLITGVLLHDIGKTVEFEGPAVYHYSLEGKLLGHISIMVAEIKEAAHQLNITSEVPLLLAHMVLSHHNEPEYGSPVPPLTKEAFLLTMIDNLDSKMMVIDKALETVEPGEFTAKVFPLNSRMLYKPKK